MVRGLWYERQRPSPLLRPLSAAYGTLVAGRLRRPTARPPVPVIVVGNLTAGGSGKTPVVEALARFLDEQGRSVGIISRGYGGSEPARPVRVGPETPVEIAGDEALMLARATGRPVWIGRRRDAALDAAVESGVDVVISDDGLQHRPLARSFEICVIDGRRGFGNGALLPAGPLRQPVDRLASVDAVLVKAPIVAELPGRFESFELRSTGIEPLRPGVAPLPSGGAVDGVAGIADPDAFFDALGEAGHVVRRHPLADHARIDSAWLSRLTGPVVMTAKDAVRVGQPVRDDLYVAGVEAVLPGRLLETVRSHVREFSP